MERSTLSRQRRHKLITMTPVFDTHWSILCPRRCPEKKIASKFTMVESKGYAEAEIPMYRFADFNVVNIQCDIFICRGSYRFEFPWFYSLEEFPFSVEKKIDKYGPFQSLKNVTDSGDISRWSAIFFALLGMCRFLARNGLLRRQLPFLFNTYLSKGNGPVFFTRSRSRSRTAVCV